MTETDHYDWMDTNTGRRRLIDIGSSLLISNKDSIAHPSLGYGMEGLRQQELFLLIA